MRMTTALRGLLLLLTLSATRHAAAATVTVCLDENPWPPYSFLRQGADGRPPELAGYTVELATAALRALEQPFRIRHLPWTQVHRLARSPDPAERCDLIWDISATPEREAYLHFTDPIYKLQYTLMFRQARFPRGTPLRQIGDLKTWKTCGVKDYNYGKLPTQIDLRRAESIQDALNLLARGRCDFFLIEASVLAQGQSLGLYKTDALGCMDMNQMSKAYRLAVAHAAENAPLLAANLRKALDALRRNGTQARLAREYRVAFPECHEKLD